MPLFTVVTATRDRPEELRAALRSVLAQDLSDFEHLVVDDAPERAAAESVAAEAGDPRVRVLRLPESKGPAGARNAALAEARGEFVAVLDDDDTMLPGRLRRTLEAFRARPELVLVGGAYEVIDEAGATLAVVRPPTGEAALRSLLPRHNPFCHSAVTVRRETLAALGGYREAFRYAHDYDMILRAAERGAVASLPDPVAGYRFHVANISAGRAALQGAYAEAARRCAARRARGLPEDLEGELASLPGVAPRTGGRRARGRVRFQLGEWMFQDGRMAGARRHLFAAIRDDPLRPLAYGLLLASVAPAWLRRALGPIARPLLARRYPRWS
jgi:hypothetical protein